MERIIQRIYDTRLKESLKANLIDVILGPRQTGKTTSVNKLLKDISDKEQLRLNFDSSMVRKDVLEDENYIIKEIESVIKVPFESYSGKSYLFIDEAQKLPASFEVLKILYDRHNPKLKIILTGSSSMGMLDKTTESLSGRARNSLTKSTDI